MPANSALRRATKKVLHSFLGAVKKLMKIETFQVFLLKRYCHATDCDECPVKNVTLYIFSCLFDGSLVWFKNDIKSDGNPIIFSKMPWEFHDLTLSKIHVTIGHGK